VTINIESHGEDTSIREVPFWQILDTKVDDGVFFVERHCAEDFEIRAVGLVNGRLIAGKKNGEIVKRGPLAFDEEGLACYDSELCGKSVNEYDRLFLGNYQMFLAWGRAHEELIESVRSIVFKENKKIRQLYAEFKANELPRMVAQAKDRIKIAEYSDIEPSYADQRLVEAASRAKRVHEYTSRKDESGLFRLWYVDYIKSKGYEKKLKETYLLYETDIKEILPAEIDSLKRNGFRMSRRAEIPGELMKLREKMPIWASRMGESI
jgi:hypothetical protein